MKEKNVYLFKRGFYLTKSTDEIALKKWNCTEDLSHNFVEIWKKKYISKYQKFILYVHSDNTYLQLPYYIYF